MKIRRILIEEIIRAFAFGAVVFMTLSFFYRSDCLVFQLGISSRCPHGGLCS
jgi:hypothetical protein